MDIIKNDGIAVIGDEGWFIGREDMILYHIFFPEYTIQPVANIGHSEKELARQYQKCVFNSKYVVCMPDQASDLVIFNTDDYSIKRLDLDVDSERLAIVNGWLNESVLWCVSYGEHLLFQIDIIEETVRKIDLREEIGYRAEMVEKRIYIPLRNKAGIIAYDIANNCVNEIKIDILEKEINTITYCEGDSFLLSTTKHAYIWDGRDTLQVTFEEDSLIKNEDSDEKGIFYEACKIDNYVICFPWNIGRLLSKYIYLINFTTMESKQIYYTDLFENIQSGMYWIYEGTYNGRVLLCDSVFDRFFEFDIETGEWKENKTKYAMINPEREGKLVFRGGEYVNEMGIGKELYLFLSSL